MRLELGTFGVKEAAFSERSQLVSGKLFIHKQELEGLLARDPNLAKVEVALAFPGERARIVHALDVIEPRVKVRGRGCAFPGFLGPPVPVGEGRTHVLSGVAVVESGEFSKQGRGLLFAREQIIDMSGPGADHSPFSQTINVVLSFEARDGVCLEEYDNSIRLAGLRAANYLAELTRGLEPDRIEVFELTGADGSLPRVGYMCQVEATGPLLDTFLYGESIRGCLGTIIHPNELMDGAMVGSKHSMGIETYIHCNNPVVKELYGLHCQEINFVGMVLTVGGGSKKTDFAKGRDAYYAAKLLKLLKAEGAVLTQEGGGNSIMDQMLLCKACEELGIKTALVSYEMGGADGTDFPLIFTVPEADAMVSVGNREEKVLLPAMERVIGGTTAYYGKFKADESFEINMTYLKASEDQAGFWNVRAWDY